MPQGFLARVAGVTRQILATVQSAGVANAGDVVALGPDGRLHESVLPVGIGADTQIAVASELIGAGKYVQFFDDGGVFAIRLADNSNNRPADGFVLSEFALGASATVYPLDSVNSELAGLAISGRYWLGTAGGVIAVALDETDPANAGKVSQYLGKAKSATELVTTDSDPVVL